MNFTLSVPTHANIYLFLVTALCLRLFLLPGYHFSPKKPCHCSFKRRLQPAFSRAVISCHPSLNNLVHTCSSKLSENATKKVLLQLLRPGGDSASRPEGLNAPVGHTGSKEWLFEAGSCREEGGAELWHAGLLLLSVRQRTVVSGGRGRARDD